jgi:protease-4
MNSQDDIPAAGPAAGPAATEPLVSAATMAAPASATSKAPEPSPRPGLEEAVQALARDLMQERRTDRRWRVFFRMCWLLLVVGVLWMLMTDRLHHSNPSGPHTALIDLRGEIASDTEASAEQLVAGLRNAFEDSNTKAVVLRINSPGGSPVQAGIINDEIHRLKTLHQIKVYAVVEEMCASGAYYVAVAADEIFVDKASIVGSIGVLMDGFGFDGLMGKLGVERRLITAGKNKGMLDPYSPLNPKHRAMAQAMIDQVHEQFISVVREGRGKRLKETEDTFSGLFWNGEEAVKMGLADQLGNLDYVAREVVKAEDVVDFTPRENVAEKLAKRFGAAMGEGAMRAAGGLGRIH